MKDSQLIKDPDADLDYGHNWTEWLAGDLITASTWVAKPDGLTLHTESLSGTQTTVWARGGVVGCTYKLVNRITTTAGRIEDRTIKLKVQQR